MTFSLEKSVARILEDDRVTVRKPGAPASDGRCVVYWMQRTQRGIDNHALDVAVNAANLLGLPVVVFLAPVPYYPHANLRHYMFLSEGIADIKDAVERRGIGFVLRRFPDHSLQKFLDEVKPALLVGDENPMREPEHWRQVVAQRLPSGVPFWTVDADVVVPSKLLVKEQFAAYTIRPRLHRELERFLVPAKNPKAKEAWERPRGLKSLPVHVEITEGWEIDRSVASVKTFRAGTKAALETLRDFVENKLPKYSERRNLPEVDGTSRLSPYLHFGHIGPVTVALAVKNSRAPQSEKDGFLDEMIVWRELAINFVRFNPNYDSIENAEPWARQSLAEHAKDPRPRLYTEQQIEAGETHDELWNAAQLQMVHTGWMHNYMRMYWAKKILEWLPSPARAYNLALRLNDKYLLDGRDPNGYAGVAWAIAGKHDRAWFDRPIFGKVRYMSAQSAAKKFNVKAYIKHIDEVAGKSLLAVTGQPGLF